jgi:hypothetical protein
MGSGSVVEETQQTTAVLPPSTKSTSPPEWGDLPPAAVIKQLKQLTPEVLYSCRLREFYKSYPSWERMTPEQKNKTLAWFHTLPAEVKGKYFLFFFRLVFNILFSFCAILFCSASVLVEARNDWAMHSRQETAANRQTTKDDIARLLHLFEEPMAQRHWSNLYSVLSGPELDARKSSREYSESANPLEFLAEISTIMTNFNCRT